MSKADRGSKGSGNTETAAPDIGEDTLSREEIFETLSNRRRRYALHCLRQHNESPIALGDLSEQVAAWETEQEIEEVSCTERKRVYTSLQQFHLPKLDEKEIISFDPCECVVELDEAATDVDIYLEVTNRYDVPWSMYYLGLAGVSILCVGLSWVGIAPFAKITYQGWIAFILTALLLFALAHTVVTHFMRLGREGKPPELLQ